MRGLGCRSLGTKRAGGGTTSPNATPAAVRTCGLHMAPAGIQRSMNATSPSSSPAPHNDWSMSKAETREAVAAGEPKPMASAYWMARYTSSGRSASASPPSISLRLAYTSSSSDVLATFAARAPTKATHGIQAWCCGAKMDRALSSESSAARHPPCNSPACKRTCNSANNCCTALTCLAASVGEICASQPVQWYDGGGPRLGSRQCPSSMEPWSHRNPSSAIEHRERALIVTRIHHELCV